MPVATRTLFTTFDSIEEPIHESDNDWNNLIAHLHFLFPGALPNRPNYNFKGAAYYESACHPTDASLYDLQCVFPSEQVADRHSKMAMDKVEELRKLNRISNKKGNKGGKNKGKNKQAAKSPSTVTANDATSTDEDDAMAKKPIMLSDVEVQWLAALRVLTCCPGVDPDLSNETVGRPFADAMRKVYLKYSADPDIAYCFAESLMVLNAWQLYEYPSGKPVSPDVVEIRRVLEEALQLHPRHAGLCHMCKFRCP